jgi:hypothetical protein
VRRADTVQLRAQEIDKPTKIRIVVQRDPLRVYEVVRQRLRRSWSKALVRHGSEARLALATVLGMPAEDIRVRESDR